MAATAVDRAYEWLRESIVRGSLETGSFVDEATVVEATGVSRTPVREAFHRLAGEQYIRLIPRRGAQVREVGAKEVYEVFAARFALESFALQELCQRRAAPPADMTDAFETMVAFPLIDSPERSVEFGRLDIRFHRAYVAAIDNQLMLRLYDSLRPMHERSSLTQARLSGHDMRDVATAQHRELLEALRAGDASRATRVIREHLSPQPEVHAFLPS